MVIPTRWNRERGESSLSMHVMPNSPSSIRPSDSEKFDLRRELVAMHCSVSKERGNLQNWKETRVYYIHRKIFKAATYNNLNNT